MASPTPSHVSGHSRLPDLDPQLQQFAMNTRGAPQPVGQVHLPDPAPDLYGYPRPTAARERFPAPIQAEARSMPTQDGLGLDNGDGLQRRWEQPAEPNEDQSVSRRELWLR